MDNVRHLYSSRQEPSSEQEQDLLLDVNALPEPTEEVERLLEELQQQELDVDRHVLQKVLEYARKA
ncbi:MAG: hypothetical protein LBK18_05990 [Prevotellaceae bacterium]|jgi:hypothetical protein|nr:hypothetical protein [Prevotellaceae bacterium]